MTGKDLIIYILKNNLENEVLFEDGKFVGMMDIQEAAVKFNVGMPTVWTWYMMGDLEGVIISNRVYFLREVEDPREKRDDKQ